MDSPTDYTGNSKKAKEQSTTEVPDKKFVKVVTGDVNVKKPGVGSKFKTVFLGADMKGVAKHAVVDVVVPELRNMMFDACRAALAQFIYGENGRKAQSRLTDYNGASRSYSYRNDSRVINARLADDPRDRGPLPSDVRSGPRGQINPQDRIFAVQADAERILETFKEALEQYEWVTHADFIMTLGEVPQTVDHKWGWNSLTNVPIVHVRDGWIIDFPPMKEIV